ncbi:MAG: hypothetical protein WCF17_09470 [Terracidiphilus sp.]
MRTLESLEYDPIFIPEFGPPPVTASIRKKDQYRPGKMTAQSCEWQEARFCIEWRTGDTPEPGRKEDWRTSRELDLPMASQPTRSGVLPSIEGQSIVEGFVPLGWRPHTENS